MDNKPLVSVITVTYNSSDFVRDAIESVLNLDYKNIEYIIGDDCSTDQTWDIIKEYKDPRINAYRNEKNIGEYPNRNKALEKATGKYLIFIDGDDLIYAHGADFFVRYMEAFPTAEMAIQKEYKNNMIYPALVNSRDMMINHFYGRTSLLSSSFTSTFFKTATLKNFGLSNKYTSGDDEIRIRIASKYPVLLLPGWVSFPRETPGQASSRISEATALIENYAFFKAIFLNNVEHELDQNLINSIHASIKRKLSRFIIKKLAKGKITDVRKILTATDLKIKDITGYLNHPISYTDKFEGFTPKKPYKENTTP